MCGILGFFDTAGKSRGAPALGIGRAMAAALVHRGPDDEGLWQDPDTALLLGFRRLAIIDLSPAGHQPMISASGRYVIVFNGEIYNFPALQQDLEGQGVKFRGRSDTEIMLAAFDQWGLNRALPKLNGMFAFALWDRQERRLHLVRDRLGKKPLYVGWAGSSLLFASELKAFRAHPDFKAAVSRDALALYMRYANVPAPYSIYQGVWQIPAGCRLTLDGAAVAGTDLAPLMEAYWQIPRVIDAARQSPLDQSDADAAAGFEDLLRRSVRDRMLSDVPLGAMLSGGIDSSLVVALMQQQAAQAVKTYTIGFRESGYNEADHARAVALHLGTDHHEMMVGPQDALNIIPRLADIYDEPFADESQIPAVIISAFARRQVTVALTGDGGDELMGGYGRHSAGAALWRNVGWLPHPLRQAIARRIRQTPAARLDALRPNHPRFGEKMLKAAALLAARGPNDVYRGVISRWDDPATLVLGGREPVIPLTDPAHQPRGLAFAERMMAADALSYLPNDILVKMDRASMAASLECRAPLLDHRLFEHAWRLPLHQKIRDGQGKWLLRQILAKHVPAALINRPKQGFSVPVAAWLQGPLKDWADDLLDDAKIRQQGYLNPAAVKTARAAFAAGSPADGYRLWTVLMFQAWQARWQ